MTRFLFKTEPREYSFDDLERDRHTTWDGVKNPLALRYLRSAKEGDEVIVYHTGEERQAIGLAKVMRAAYADPKKKSPRSVVVDLLVGRRFTKPVTLDAMKGIASFESFELLKLPRLSVMPVTDAHWMDILRLAGMIARR